MRNRRRILMIGTSLETQGGISAVVRVLKAAEMLDTCGVEYIASHCDGSPFRKLATVLMGWLRFMVHLLRYKVRVVHIHMSIGASFWRKLLFIYPAKSLQIPYVLHLHSGNLHGFYESGSFWRKFLIRRSLASAAYVVVLSNSWRTWVSSTVPNARIVRIYNPVLLPNLVAGVREQSTLLYLGRVGAAKGAYDLLQAVAKIAHRFPDCRVLLAGDGDLHAARGRAESLGISDRVELLGWINGAQKQELLERSSIYVLPSYSEGLPMSVLEAMSAGLPVISTPVGGIPEAVTHGTEGFLVQPGDIDGLAESLSTLLGDALLRGRMGRAARKKSEDSFSTTVIVPRFKELYADLGCQCSS